ncbi:hypothetical protein ACWIUD_11920 [Helicobacter sp. 23-1044]
MHFLPLPCGVGLRGWVDSISFCEFRVDSAFFAQIAETALIFRHCEIYATFSSLRDSAKQNRGNPLNFLRIAESSVFFRHCEI